MPPKATNQTILQPNKHPNPAIHLAEEVKQNPNRARRTSRYQSSKVHHCLFWQNQMFHIFHFYLIFYIFLFSVINQTQSNIKRCMLYIIYIHIYIKILLYNIFLWNLKNYTWHLIDFLKKLQGASLQICMLYLTNRD